jgi:hypothetical protein
MPHLRRWSLIPGINRYRDWYRLEELRRRVELLRAEIGHIEKARVAGQGEQLSSFDRFVQGYRHNIYDDQLGVKQSELETLLPELNALEAKQPKAPPARPPKSPRPEAAPRQRGPIRRIAMVSVPLFAVVAAAIVLTRPGSPPEPKLPEPTELAPVTRRPMREPGELFFTREVPFTYQGGRVIISGEPQVTGQFWVDDKIVLTVTAPDGSVAAWEKTFNENCTSNRAAPAEDITGLFKPGPNRILVEMFDVCGADVGTLNKVLLTEI